jgi:hypothetical protein
MPTHPSNRIYKKNSKGSKTVKNISIIAIVCFVFTIGLVLCSWWSQKVGILYILFGLWAIITPFWFWWEFFFLYRKYGTANSLDLFKHGQQVSGALWAGLLACLIALATSEHMTQKTSNKENTSKINLLAK